MNPPPRSRAPPLFWGLASPWSWPLLVLPTGPHQQPRPLHFRQTRHCKIRLRLAATIPHSYLYPVASYLVKLLSYPSTYPDDRILVSLLLDSPRDARAMLDTRYGRLWTAKPPKEAAQTQDY